MGEEKTKVEEKEVTLDFEHGDKYDPLEQDVEQDKDLDINSADAEEIPEPDFSPPPPPPDIEDAELVGEEKSTGIMSEVSELPPDQRKVAAEQLTDITLKSYNKLHALGRWFGKISEDDVSELIINDEIDPNMVVPLNETGTKSATVGEFIEDYNEQVDEGISVSDGFINTVRDPMIRVYIQNGWGLTDEWLLAYMFGEDLSTKVGMLVGFKKTMSKCLKAFTTAHSENKKQDARNAEEDPFDDADDEPETKTEKKGKPKTEKQQNKK